MTNKEEYISNVCGVGKVFSDKERDYLDKTTFDVVKFADGSLLPISKSNMETRFCFSYDEYMDCHCKTNTYKEALDAADNVGFEYFLKENLKDIENRIKHLEEEEKVYFVKYYWRGSDKVVGFQFWEDNNCIRELTSEEKNIIINVLKKQIENKTKRCQTWWKKYGKEKLKTWTYSCWD